MPAAMVRLLFIICLGLLCVPGYVSAQSATDSAGYGQLDTLKAYEDPDLRRELKKGKVTYYANNKKVSKEVYDARDTSMRNFNACRPCVMEYYGGNDRLLWQGEFYTDCPVGDWYEYYPNGKIKVEGHYKEYTGDWSVLAPADCSVKQGVWTYYDPFGNVSKTEVYKDGVLVE